VLLCVTLLRFPSHLYHFFRSDGSGADHPTRNRSADASKRTARRLRAEENAPLVKQDKVLVFLDVEHNKIMPALCSFGMLLFYERISTPFFFRVGC
jgi:hypothetical protein